MPGDVLTDTSSLYLFSGLFSFCFTINFALCDLRNHVTKVTTEHLQ
uniref:Uncharacterized protein n=1 Tax=Anguilla anguilla TaxID=7936 RepID=A0A0E9V346_ANGAN